MPGARTPSRPSFFWQGVLIVLPVVALVAVGVYSLRQDKRLAQREAENRAQAIADDLVPLIWNELTARETNGLPQPSFTVDANGQLISPPTYDVVPRPNPFDLTALNPEQTRLWQALQRGEATSRNDESLIETYEAFIDSDPPDNFAAAANYRLGLELVQLRKLPEATGRFGLVAEEYSDAVGESGLPLGPLALFKLFEIQPQEKDSSFPGPRRARVIYSRPRTHNFIAAAFPPGTMERTFDHFVTLELLSSNIVNRPTPLTPYLLQELQDRGVTETRMQDALRQWQRVWDGHELSRELFAAARGHLPTNHLLSVTSAVPPLVEMPRLFWFDTATGLKTAFLGVEEQHWLALRSENDTNGISYACLAESKIGMRVSGLMEQVKSLPSYFGVGIELANKPVNEFAPNLREWQYRHYGGKGGRIDREDRDKFATNLLASATKVDAGANLLRVNVYLTNPKALFQSQRTRAFSFGLLIALASVAAMIGLFTAWRAFHRQLHLSEMKSNFVSSVSHELRAPIASVRLLAESLERGKVSEPVKQNEYFRFIGQECRRLSSLIENVLDFSRIEQGRKQYEFEPTNVGALVEQTVKLMQPYAAEKGVRLETFNIQHSTANAQCSEARMDQSGALEFPSPGLSATLSPSEGERDGVRGNLQPATCNLELNVDGRAIQQALVNLIDNAIKHSPKDSVVTVRLETRSAECGVQNADAAPRNPQPLVAAKRSEDGSTINLSVTDHGPGIPTSEQEKIFERFYRLGSELRRETQGVGIGLSIVKHIVAAHGGRVRVDSEVGQGSRFTIELPQNQQEQTEETEWAKK